MFKKIMLLCFLLWNMTVLAIDADFSKSFVAPETSGMNSLTIGGIDANGNTYKVNLNLRSDLTLTIADAQVEKNINEQLERELRNTTWKGTYEASDSILQTTLQLVVVQYGYVGGEITHKGTGDSYLTARVTGDIVTQFKINDEFIDEDRIDPEILANISSDTENRQLIRIKRMRALEFNSAGSSANSGWNANREYRLLFDDNVLSGVVGIPNEIYGTNDTKIGSGSITLVKQ